MIRSVNTAFGNTLTGKPAHEHRLFWPIIGLGTLAFLLLGWLAIGHSASSARALSEKLALRANAALVEQGQSWAQVMMRGQVAYLTGAAPNDAARDAAKLVVLKADGPGGVLMGGVTKVKFRLDEAQLVSPFTWGARRTGDAEIELVGHVPNSVTKASLYHQARTIFAGYKVQDNTIIAAGAPTGDWLKIATTGLSLMRNYADGAVSMSDLRLTIRGTATNADDESLAANTLELLPKPYFGENAIVRDQDVPELRGIDLAANPDQTNCNRAFETVGMNNTLTFDSGQATLKRESLPTLDKLALVAKRCADFRIDVAGYTDDRGDSEANRRLSEARAIAMKSYLAALGVSATRVTAIGYGEENPKATNSTAAGRALNRRLEFTVRPEGVSQ